MACHRVRGCGAGARGLLRPLDSHGAAPAPAPTSAAARAASGIHRAGSAERAGETLSTRRVGRWLTSCAGAKRPSQGLENAGLFAHDLLVHDHLHRIFVVALR
jgi:hypothetical protein